MRVDKTPTNPHGLTAKQLLVIEDMAKKSRQGKPLDPIGSVKKFYDVSSDASAASVSNYNLRKKDFRMALLEELEGNGALDTSIGKKLSEGLEATTDRGEVDFNARLKYIQEINKITGVYAPTQTEKKSMNLNLDMTETELNERIKELQSELE